MDALEAACNERNRVESEAAVRAAIEDAEVEGFGNPRLVRVEPKIVVVAAQINGVAGAFAGTVTIDDHESKVACAFPGRDVTNALTEVDSIRVSDKNLDRDKKLSEHLRDMGWAVVDGTWMSPSWLKAREVSKKSKIERVDHATPPPKKRVLASTPPKAPRKASTPKRRSPSQAALDSCRSMYRNVKDDSDDLPVDRQLVLWRKAAEGWYPWLSPRGGRNKIRYLLESGDLEGFKRFMETDDGV